MMSNTKEPETVRRILLKQNAINNIIAYTMTNFNIQIANDYCRGSTTVAADDTADDACSLSVTDSAINSSTSSVSFSSIEPVSNHPSNGSSKSYGQKENIFEPLSDYSLNNSNNIAMINPLESLSKFTWITKANMNQPNAIKKSIRPQLAHYRLHITNLF